MPIHTKSINALTNSKIKIYRDGSYTIIRSNRNIFRSPDFEKKDTCNTGYIENCSLKNQTAKHLDKHVFTFHDLSGKPVKFWDVSKEFKRRSPFKSSIPRNDSLKRAKQSIFDIIYQNDFRWFITITLNKSLIDRNNPVEIIKKLRKWLNNMKSRKGLEYVLVPEYHEKGGIHCHALINDCSLDFVDSSTRLVPGYDKPVLLSTIRNKHICEKIGIVESDLRVVYNITNWKYGWSTAIQTYGNCSTLAFYISKYVTKDVKKIFGKFFYSSKGLVRKTDEKFFNSDFSDDLPVVTVPNSGTCYQYESSFCFNNSQIEKNTADILQILKENGLD